MFDILHEVPVEHSAKIEILLYDNYVFMQYSIFNYISIITI